MLTPEFLRGLEVDLRLHKVAFLLAMIKPLK